MLKIRFDANFDHLGIYGVREKMIGNALISRTIPPEEADAVFVYWEPTELLDSYKKTKIYYCCEPSYYFQGVKKRGLRKIINNLTADEFVYHNHPNASLRVPHPTHCTKNYIENYQERDKDVVTLVSNITHPLVRHTGMRYRIDFITHPLVDLYGNKQIWMNFKKSIFSSKQAPNNYKGELPCRHRGKFELFSKYKVAVCLENSIEENYFTEKFVHAVQAGCIPIYHAHPSVKNSILKGAFWVDPSDFNHNPQETIKYALSLNFKDVYEQNKKWLKKAQVNDTHLYSVYGKIIQILSNRIEGKISDKSKILRNK